MESMRYSWVINSDDTRGKVILQNLDQLRDVVGVQEVPDAPEDAHWNGDVLQNRQKDELLLNYQEFFFLQSFNKDQWE